MSPALQLVMEAKGSLSPYVSDAEEMIEVSKKKSWKCGKVRSSQPWPIKERCVSGKG